jgi:predicted phosphatase
MQIDKDEHQILQELMVENQKLLTENNHLLQKMMRYHHWGVFFKGLGLLVVLGVPVAFYYYIMEPYFYNITDSLKTLNDSLSTVPGWSQFIEAISHGKNGPD